MTSNEEKTQVCCPYCSCKDISKSKDRGLMEIGPLEFSEEEGYPVDVWVCSKCLRRFVLIDESEDGSIGELP